MREIIAYSVLGTLAGWAFLDQLLKSLKGGRD